MSSRAAIAFALIFCAALNPALLLAQNSAPAPAPASSTAPGVLHPADLAKILPAEVFFRGQKATLQLRNSAGVRWPSDSTPAPLTFAALVDTAGYSSALTDKYQAYLITEVPLVFAGKQALAAGAYGIGFEDGGGFVVMDLGGHDLFVLEYTRDAALKRPMPLEIIPAPASSSAPGSATDSAPAAFRLYFGRNYIAFASVAHP